MLVTPGTSSAAFTKSACMTSKFGLFTKICCLYGMPTVVSKNHSPSHNWSVCWRFWRMSSDPSTMDRSPFVIKRSFVDRSNAKSLSRTPYAQNWIHSSARTSDGDLKRTGENLHVRL